MTPRPIVLGLTICDYVIFEERTRKVSLIGGYSVLKVHAFPSMPRSFCVFSALTNGLGDAKVELVGADLLSGEEMLSLDQVAHFPSKLAEVQVLFRVNGFSFPRPGHYQFTLLLDGEWIAQRRIRVEAIEESP